MGSYTVVEKYMKKRKTGEFGNKSMIFLWIDIVTFVCYDEKKNDSVDGGDLVCYILRFVMITRSF